VNRLSSEQGENKMADLAEARLTLLAIQVGEEDGQVESKLI
jgi:hypothetical protein